jgi:hypothetical protein
MSQGATVDSGGEGKRKVVQLHFTKVISKHESLGYRNFDVET